MDHEAVAAGKEADRRVGPEIDVERAACRGADDGRFSCNAAGCYHVKMAADDANIGW